MEQKHFINRTLSEFHDVNRSPVDGYQDQPVLSLEKSIEHIIPLVPRVMDYVTTAKKECNRKSSLLTWDQSAAIYLYTMPTAFFSRLNDTLRAKDRNAVKPWFAFLKLFTSALEDLPSIEKTVWRGIQGNASSEFADGDVHIWWSITSCSRNLNVVERYLGDIGTLFVIDTVHGKDISVFSTFPDEEEIILMPGTHLHAKATSFGVHNCLFIVNLKEENDESDVQSKSNHLFEKIRQQYRENAYIERIMNPKITVPIEQSYINLAIVESREQQEKERKLCKDQPNNEILGTFEEIYGVKTSIDLKNIFEKCHDYRKQVLIFGRAGIGKTTFCRYITFKWATGAIWQQYQLIIFIRLRSLVENQYPPLAFGKNYSPLDLVKREFFNDDLSDEDERLLKKQLRQSQVLWLLDGYDEIIQNVPTHLQYLFFDQLLKMPHLILTSRPYLNTLSYEVQLEITGFTDDNIKHYVKQFFEQVKDEIDNASFQAQHLLSSLKSSLRIWGIAHIPVNLELLCSFSCDNEWPKTRAPMMTNIYETMIEWLCRRHLEKQGISPDGMMKEAVYEHCQKELAFLESLAFYGMKSNSIVLRPELLQMASEESNGSLQSHPHLLNIGILKSLDYKPIGTRIQANKNHYFVHFSFQEYFAAQYLIKALGRTTDQKKSAIDFIKSHKYNQRYELVFTFVSGLLIDKNDKQSIDSFWDTIMGEPLDLIGVRHVQLVIACIEETNCNQSLPRFNELLESIVEWIEYFILKEPDHRYKYLKASLRRSPSLVNQPKILETIKTLYYNEDLWTKRNAYLLIAGLPTLKSHLDLTSLHIEALNDQDPRIQTTACEALKGMDDKLVTEDVIDRLINGIETSTDAFTESAINILVKVNNNSISDIVLNRILIVLGKRPYTALDKMHERFMKLLRSIIDNGKVQIVAEALKDGNDFVRCGACRAFGHMAEELKAVEVIDSLVALISDTNSTVGQSACFTLGIIGEREANTQVIDGLVVALLGVDIDVKCSACEALGRIGEKGANVKVINTLMTTLQDVNEDVKCSVCEALGRIGETAATADVLSSLITTIGDPSDKVKHSACDAIGRIGRTAATIEVIICLRDALQSVNQDIRYIACKALGRIGEKATSIELINILVNALQDSDKSVRCQACEALGRIDEKVVITEVFTGLTVGLQDAEHAVRYSACVALEQIGEKLANMEAVESMGTEVVNQELGSAVNSCDTPAEVETKAATDTVIIRLVSVLDDTNYSVRNRAYEALEKICIGAAKKSVISKLIAALGAENAEYRLSASSALYRIGNNLATIETISSLVAALQNTNHHVKNNACRILGEIGEKAINKELIDGLAAASTDPNETVRESACSALGKLGEKTGSADVINSLIIAFGDKNQDVRCSAYKGIGRMSSKAATTEVIDNLVSVVGDEIDKVSQSACYALGEIGEKAVSIDAINCLFNALRHTNPNIRHNACEALGKMQCKAATAELIDYCMIAVNDENYIVRESACRTLGKIDENLITNEVVSCLSHGVSDENPVVRSVACNALGIIRKKAATSEVTDSLFRALKDDDIDVRRNACDALQKIVEKVETVELINTLIELVTSSDPLVRSTACFILSKVSEVEVNTKMIDCLVNALGDEGIKVPFHAYETLRLFCEKEVKAEVVNRLEIALKSRNHEVREYVCRLLGVVAEKTITNEPLRLLLDACGDEHSAVQNTAYEVVKKIFYLYSTMSLLTDDTVSKLSLCINRFYFQFLWEVSPDEFVKGFLDTGIASWLPIIKTVLLRQGYGITVTDNTVVLYSCKEPLQLSVSNREISKRLRDGLSNRVDKATEIDSVQRSEEMPQAEPEFPLIRKAKRHGCPCICS